jgi:protein SCO1/2
MTNDPPAGRPSHRVEWLVWSALVLTVLSIAIAFAWTRLQESGLRRSLEVLGNVPDFTLTNQFARPISRSNLLGQVWVADVIFTRCPMSCERMTQRMHALENDVSARLPVRFVSVTADPGFDSPEVLKRYAERHQVDQSRWHFFTGIKRDVYGLSVGGLKFAVVENESKTIPDDLFVHSTQFALIDKRGRIRGYFEGTEEGDRKQLLLAVKKLAREN